MSPRVVTIIGAVLFVACTSNSYPNNSPPPGPAPLLVQGTDMSGSVQNVRVTRSGTAVTTASVVVNGTPLSNAGAGLYRGPIDTPVSAGGQVTVVVTDSGQVATGVGAVPAAAVIGSTVSTKRGAPVTINWTSATSPDSFFVSLNYDFGGGSAAVLTRTSGSARQVTLETTDVPASSTIFSIGIFGYNIGSWSGAYATSSNMRVRTDGADKTFTFGVP